MGAPTSVASIGATRNGTRGADAGDSARAGTGTRGGIGGGAMANGRLLHGLVHPEFGHMRIPHDRDRDPFDGVCPFHGGAVRLWFSSQMPNHGKSARRQA